MSRRRYVVSLKNVMSWNKESVCVIWSHPVNLSTAAMSEADGWKEKNTKRQDWREGRRSKGMKIQFNAQHIDHRKLATDCHFTIRNVWVSAGGGYGCFFTALRLKLLTLVFWDYLVSLRLRKAQWQYSLWSLNQLSYGFYQISSRQMERNS